MVVADTLARSRNSFNLVRLLAAAAVIVSHARSIREGLVDELLEASTPFALGDHAVNVFFVLSGLLIAHSWERTRDARAFAVARALRIFPALVACALACAFVLGPALTTLPIGDYLRAADTWTFPLRIVALFDDEAALPGVFEDAPYDASVIAPVWTLFWELAAYVCLAVMGLLGALRDRRRFAVVAAGVFALYVANELREAEEAPDTLDRATRFAVLYMLGAGAWMWRDRLPINVSILAALAALVWLSRETMWEDAAWMAAVGYGGLWLGAWRLPWVSDATDRADLSYGLYIYGWPAGQVVNELAPLLPEIGQMGWTLAAALACAAASWTLVEAPALRRKLKREPVFALR